MTPDEAARRQTINRLAILTPAHGTPPWTPRLITEYLTATNDLTPAELTAAVDTAIRTRTIRPAPAQLRPKPTSSITSDGRDIGIDPRHQTPASNGIRQWVHDIIKVARRTKRHELIRDALTDPFHPPTPPETLELQAALRVVDSPHG